MADSTPGTTILGISKTSINGWLAFLITTLTTIVAFQIPAALQTPQESHIWLWVTLVCNAALALMRAWVGMLQGDTPPAGK